MALLAELKLNFEITAAGLGDYQSLTKAQLADGYCDADESGDETKRSQYFSALMLRYWFKIFKWKQDSASLNLADEDFVDWLVDCLNDAIYYRSWRKIRHDHDAEEANGHTQVVWIDNPQFYDDPNAADRSINYFCGAKRGKEYQFHNKHKRKANVQTYSVDAQQEEIGDSALDYSGAYTEEHVCNGAQDLIQYYLRKDKECNDSHVGERGISALILDAIINQDVNKETKTKHVEIITPEVDEDEDSENVEQVEPEKETYYTYNSTFDPRKLVKHLNSINLKFMQNYFEKEYGVSSEQGETILGTLKKMDNGKLYTVIKRTFKEIQDDPKLLSYLTK